MIIDALRRSEVFGALPEASLQALADAGTARTLDPGERLLAEGTQPDAMYVVLDGVLEVTKRVGDADVLVNTCDQGELIGELGVIHERPRSASVRARTAATVLAIGTDTLDELLAAPSTARALLKSATDRLDREQLILRYHERMAALGMLTAGLLHEINNPAAAVQRSVARLRGAVEALVESDEALSDPGLVAHLRDRLAGLDPQGRSPRPDPLARADAEDRLRSALDDLGVERPWEPAAALADIGLEADQLAALLAGVPESARDPALRWLAARGSIVRLLDEAGQGIARVAELVTSVRSYAHHEDDAVSDVEVHAGLELALTLLRHKTPSGVTVVRDYAPDLPPVTGRPGDLNSVWTNLVDNALDAMGATGTLTLRTSSDETHVTVEIANTGPPIPPRVLERVFDPFFTTKPVGEGTGLGLSTSFSIVTQRHHGQLSLESTPEVTTATVVLPRHH